MFRLLEILEADRGRTLREANQSERLISDARRFEGGHQCAHAPIWSVSRLEVHLRQNVKANAAAYLRAAQAYMLISMPTGTSTIFGVFQAILALLTRPGECRPSYKLLRKEKFASEIFGRSQYLSMLRCNKNSHICATRCQTSDGSTGSGSCAPRRRRILFGIGAAGFHINSL
jgi:hypothetical protein